MLDSAKEQELLQALRSAENSTSATAVENAVNSLALYYVMIDRFLDAAPFWRRGAELLASIAPRSCELATYLHNMAATCLIPAGLREEARTVLCRSRELYGLHFRNDSKPLRDVDELLKHLDRGT